jgi:hypothetical protein
MVASGRLRMRRWEDIWRRRGINEGDRKIARVRVSKKKRRDLKDIDIQSREQGTAGYYMQ